MKPNSVVTGGVTSREAERNHGTNPLPVDSKNKVPDSPPEEIELKNISEMNIEKLDGISEGYKKQFCDELKKLLENLKTADSVDKIKEYINIFNEALKNDKYAFIASDITNLDDNKLSEKELKNHVNDFTKTANGSLKKYEGNKNFSSFWKSISNIFSAFLAIFKPNALFNAIKNNNVNLVEKLIVKSYKNKINKALHFATEQGNAKIINILFEHGADPNHNDKYGNNSLMLAIKNKKINVINKLIEKDVDLNSTNNEGKNALILAVENDLNLNIVGKLIKCGADVNTCDNNGNTPLLVAIKQENLAIVEALINASADINMSNNDNLSPLMSAFNHKQLDIADKLLELKSSVHEKDINGNTVLMLCINNGGNLETINKLINLGVDKNAKNNRNETATSMAIASGRPDVAKELIKNNNTTTNSTSDLDGNTPISLAVQNGYTEIVKQLIDKGVDIKMLSKDKACFHALTNAVAVAQARKDTEIIQFLTDAGFNINSVTKQKDAYEKLIIAIQKGDADTVKRLINTREIDLRLLNEKNYYYKKFINAIKVAIDKGNIDIIRKALLNKN